MSTTKHLPHEREQAGMPTPSFDVTCVVGRVEIGNGDESPHVVAMKLIAEHDAEGTYKFPMPTGGTCVVTVEYGHEH